MMKNFTLLLLFILTAALFGKIEVTTDLDEVYIGQPLMVNVQIEYPDSAVVDYYFTEKTEFGDFENLESNLVDKDIKDSLVTENWQLKYVTFSDSGIVKINPIELRYLYQGENYSESSEEIDIKIKSYISSVKVATQDSTEVSLDSLNTLMPIKGLIEYSLSTKEKMYIAGGVLALIVMALLIYFIIRRKKKKSIIPKIIIKKKEPAHIIALRKLRELKDRNLIVKNEYKEYCAELSLIIRTYLEDRYSFFAAEIPSSDLKSEVRNHVTDKNLLDEFDSMLDLTDLVKYAKFTPLETELKSITQFSDNFINQTAEKGDKKEVSK